MNRNPLLWHTPLVGRPKDKLNVYLLVTSKDDSTPHVIEGFFENDLWWYLPRFRVVATSLQEMNRRVVLWRYKTFEDSLANRIVT